MLVIGYYIFCSISNEGKLKENSNTLHGVCIEYAYKQRFSNQSIISTYTHVVFLSLQRKLREIQVNLYLYETCREIYYIAQTQKKGLFCKSTEKYTLLSSLHGRLPTNELLSKHVLSCMLLFVGRQDLMPKLC